MSNELEFKSGPIEQEPQSPELPACPFEALRVDHEQGYFRDAKRRGWFFKSEDRIWKPLELSETHPMMWQGTRVYPLEKTKIDSVEEAVLCALRAHYEHRLRLYKNYLLDPEETDADKAQMQKGIKILENILTLIEQYEKETGSRKSDLLKEIERLIREREIGDEENTKNP